MQDRRSFFRNALALSLCAQANANGKTVEHLIPIPLGNRPVATFDNGVFAVPEAQRTGVSFVDVQGRLLAEITPRLASAGVVSIIHASVTPSRQLVLALNTKDSAGRISCGFTRAGFDGSATQLFETYPFIVRRFCVLPDGPIFCLGRERTPTGEDVPGFHLIRIYSPDGKLLHKAFEIVGARSHPKEHPMYWELAPGPGRVGVWGRRDHSYCELDLDAKLVRPAGQLGVGGPVSITGLALLPNGDRLVSTQPNNGSGSFGVFQISDAPGGGVTVRPRVELQPEQGAVTAMGYHDGKLVMIGRPNDRIILVET
jgi:hypothetical protein